MRKDRAVCPTASVWIIHREIIIIIVCKQQKVLVTLNSVAALWQTRSPSFSHNHYRFAQFEWICSRPTCRCSFSWTGICPVSGACRFCCLELWRTDEDVRSVVKWRRVLKVKFRRVQGKRKVIWRLQIVGGTVNSLSWLSCHWTSWSGLNDFIYWPFIWHAML